uniref:Response regulatory domain-containing protein n=1 Tax=Bicosoecida sp. CB-2014 TaxID=1486930 RepID=A0A7S1C8K4_9STRA|mmetsp:Transcript_15966/g.55713  ORF Transcript_15966/g.55713 Transcript_15966/m.55713 type:complete len:205 (+) Transcript_15966:747-1361(+)
MGIMPASPQVMRVVTSGSHPDGARRASASSGRSGRSDAAGDGDDDVRSVTSPLMTGPLAGMHFVAVDDEEINRRILRRMFESQGATVVTLSDGSQLLPYLREHHEGLLGASETKDGRGSPLPSSASGLDAIVLDDSMPRMSGTEACVQLRHEYGVTARIVLATGNVHNEEDAARYWAAGFDAVLKKPYDATQLALAVTREAFPC